MSDEDLDSLLEDSACGNERAFAQLYDAVAPQLLAVAKGILNDHHQAEDVLQQAMISAWHGAADFDARRSRATTWLVSITRYRAIDALRQRGRQQARSDRERQEIRAVFGHDQPASQADPVSDKLAQRLAFCFGELSRDQAGCIQLAYLNGMTYPEVAAHLERSLGTVKSWIRRGLAALRECIGR